MPGFHVLFSTCENSGLGGGGSPLWTGAAPETKEPSFHSESSRMGQYGVQEDVQGKIDGGKRRKKKKKRRPSM